MKQNNYFKECISIDEVKKLYRKLAMEHHPDKGGSIEIMQMINAEYDIAIKKVLLKENISSSEFEEGILQNEKYRNVINAIVSIENITIEVVGAWIWVTGDTKPCKETLKQVGFFYAYKKNAWYFRTQENKSKHNTKTFSLDDIRKKYGSEHIQSKNRNYLN